MRLFAAVLAFYACLTGARVPRFPLDAPPEHCNCEIARAPTLVVAILPGATFHRLVSMLTIPANDE
jgi:hypothetical protein